ncbi:MAG TPA: serine/threonine-protein kinase [Enhygromyxa sp.]|nr:serine/threonine-protein kinase [Enhygromyxa sp.]
MRPSTDELGSSTDSTETSPGEPDVTSEPTRLDRYVLLEKIGRGSFATVWAAYDPQLDRRVAIKLLRPRSDGSDTALLTEAQALARLSHPNVVAVHDVQTVTAPGVGERVFIVMEHLAGVSLREWMTRPHDWREVIEVFCEAGRGLAAAHAHGLVHRDFKPSNVMFGADQRVRVLDFGLARSSSDREQHGRPSRITGTPAYMAPEQHLGDPVDARTDQFAFCAALYEALYGERPFAGRNRVDLGKAKLRGEIVPPPRSSSVPAWVLAIVQRGLAVRPDDRFASMDALLDALASDPSLARRRWAVGVALVIVTAGSALGLARLGSGSEPAPACQASEQELVGVWDDAVRANIQRSFMATELPHADAAFRRIEQALDAHTREWAQFHREVCEATLVRHEQPVEDMAEQMLCLQRRLRRIAGLITALEQADASTIARAGDAILVLESPAGCRERIAGERSEQLDGARRSGVLEVEGEIARAGVLTQVGRYEQAVAIAQGAIDQSLDLGDSGGAGRAWLAQTRALWYLGRYDEAIAASEQAMRWAVKVGDQETQAMAQIRLIRTYVSMGKYDVAEAVAKLAAVMVEGGRLGPELEAWYDLYVAILYTKQLRWDPAVVRLDHGLALRERLYGPEHPELAPFHNTWGNALLKQHDYDGALEHYHEARRLWEINFGPEYPDIASVNNNIGAIYLEQGQFDRARPYFEQVLESYQLALGPDNPQLIAPLFNLASVALGQGRRRDALALQERARALAAAAFGEDNLNTALLDYQVARIVHSLGDVERAERLAARALEIQRRDGPEDLPALVNFAELLANCQDERGDHVAARATLERTLVELGERELGGPHTAVALYLRAQLARGSDELELALELAEQHIAALAAAVGEDHHDVVGRLDLLIELLLETGDFEAAASRARDALARTSMDPNDRARWELDYLLGRAEAGRGERAAAIVAFERALERCSGDDGNPRWAALVRDELARLQ